MPLTITELPESVLKNNSAYNSHERVYRYEDTASGLVAFIAIHNSKMGSALGGTRFFAYSSEEEALTDVLNLSHSMTYKCAIADLAHGGGKGVIIGNPKTDKSKELLASYAQAVQSLSGAFYTGEDVGLSEADVQFMLTISPYFIGKSDQAGDPSEYASLSVYTLLKAATKKVFGTDDLSGKSIAIKGVGKVGLGLLKLVAPHKMKITIADMDEETITRAKTVYPQVIVVSPEEIIGEQADMYAPCAMGNEFTRENIGRLKAKIICGGANNQIIEDGIDHALRDQGILYVPDYLANAGGLINVADELEPGGYNRGRVLERIQNLVQVFERLSRDAEANSSTFLEAADTSVKSKFLV